MGGESAIAGRILGNSLQKRLDELCDEDSDMCRPITLTLFQDPVIASDGFMYEASAFKQLIQNHQVSPLTREPLTQESYPAKKKKSEATSFREKRIEALLHFAQDALPSEPRMTGIALDRVVDYLEVLKAARYPALSKRAAALWKKTDRTLPSALRPFV